MIISKSPFRVSLMGGGSDYPAFYNENGGAVLATSIDKYCLPSGTHILVDHAHIKKIEEIIVGDKVLSFNEITHEKEEDTVIALSKRIVDSTLCIKFNNGNILYLTHNHPVYIIGKGWVQSQNIKLGDEVIQYQYRQLGLRLWDVFRLGKSYQDIYGDKQYALLEKIKTTTPFRSRKGKTYSEIYGDRENEVKQKQSQARKGKTLEEILGTPDTKQTRDKMSKQSRINSKIRWANPEYKARLTKIQKDKWLDPAYREKTIRAIASANGGLSPNNAEIKLFNIVESIAPGEFRFNDGWLILDGTIPDFPNVNGKKKVIDLFGCYWHNCPVCTKGDGETEVYERSKRFGKLGWDYLVIWEHELSNEPVLATRIKEFLYNPHVSVTKVVSIEEVNKRVEVHNVETKNNHNLFAYGILVHNCYIMARRLPPFFNYNYRIRYSKQEEAQSINEIHHPSVRECLRFVDLGYGVEIQHNADLPAMSGLGSSSAFTVGLLNALYGLKGKMVTKMQLALDAIHVEQDMICENVGSQDQVAAACGGFNKIEFGGLQKITVHPITIDQSKLELLQNHLMLFWTGFPRYASEIAKEQIKRTPEKITEIKTMMGMVDDAIKSLNSNNFDDFGRLLHENWLIKRTLTPLITTPIIDEIYEVGRKAGAIGGKVCGAGNGGFMLFFVHPELQQNVKEKLSKLLCVPFKFENLGSQIIYYATEENY